MIETYNPTIKTYNEQPSCEAIKAATMVSRYAYWMCNQTTKERFHDCFGKVLGEHLWSKLCDLREAQGTLAGDLGLWLELDSTNRQKLMHYILRTNYKQQ
jgi:hypothetical protein